MPTRGNVSKGDLNRIALIGPVLPFRGGIAQHTTMLHRSLKQQAELLTMSFKKQYPAWWYPGRGAYEPGYREHREQEVVYLLEPLNPVTWVRACGLLEKHSPDAVIVAWWTVFWAPCFLFMTSYLRRRGIRLIFICHNVSEHEPAFWKTLLSRRVLSRGSGFIVQTEEEAGRLRAMLKEPRVTVHPCPVFEQFPLSRRKLPRRARLELLFFGLVRPYKGLDILIEAMDLLADEDVFLTVAGEWWIRGGRLREGADSAEKVEVIDRYIPEHEVGEYFERADAVVLPYRSSTGTGVVPLAYRYGRPVVASRIGGFTDVVEEGVSGLFFNPGDPRSLAASIRELLNNPQRLQTGAAKAAGRMTWDGLVSCILGLVGEAPTGG